MYLFYFYIHVFACLCLSPGPSGFLAGNGLHVLGQRADMETAAVISGATSGALITPTSNTHTHTHWPLTIFCFSLMLNIIVYSFTMPPNKCNLESSISARRCMRTLFTPNFSYKWLNIILLNYARWTSVWRSSPYCHFSCLWYRSLQYGREIWKHQTWRRESDDVLPPLYKMPQTSYRLCSFKDDCFSALGLLNSLQRLEICIFWHTSLFYSPCLQQSLRLHPGVLLGPHQCILRWLFQRLH